MPSYPAVSRDPGAFIYPVHGDIGVTGVAGGAGDGIEADGDWITVPDEAQGAALLIVWSATLGQGQTFSLAAKAQDALDTAGAGAAHFMAASDLPSTVVATGPAGGGTVNGVTKLRYGDIRSHRGVLRSQVTGDLSAGAADTFNYTVLWAFGGVREIPAQV